MKKFIASVGLRCSYRVKVRAKNAEAAVSTLFRMTPGTIRDVGDYRTTDIAVLRIRKDQKRRTPLEPRLLDARQTTCEEKLAWLAGFFEGEGSVTRDVVYLYQKELAVLKRVQQMFGGKLSNPITNKKTRRRCGRLVWSGLSAHQFLLAVRAYLLSARRIAEVDTILDNPRQRRFKNPSHFKFPEY